MIKFTKLEIVTTIQVLNSTLSEFLREQFASKDSANILEAGCGRKWPLDLAGVDYKLTGVDIDEHGLALRKEQQHDLDGLHKEPMDQMLQHDLLLFFLHKRQVFLVDLVQK